MGKIGDDVEIGTGVRDHAIIGDGAEIVVNTGVTRDAAPEKTILGFPADDHWHTLRLWAVQKQLSGLIKKRRKLVLILSTPPLVADPDSFYRSSERIGV